MKGKKSDPEFLSQFISDSISKNILSTEDMVKLAKSQIEDIDKKIKEVEDLKKIRSKLLDVIDCFDKELKDKNLLNTSEDICLFDIKNQHISKFICDSVKHDNVNIKCLIHKYSVDDFFFTVKELVKNKVLFKIGDTILKGEKFDRYVNLVFQEV